jgi:hypothetical protein
VSIDWGLVGLWGGRAGFVAAVVVGVMLVKRRLRAKAWDKRVTAWTETEPRLRKLRNAPGLHPDTARTIRDVLTGAITVEEAAAQLKISTEKVERARDRYRAAVPAVRVFRLVVGSWVGPGDATGIDVDRPGFTRTHIRYGLTVDPAVHEDWLLELARQYTESAYRDPVRAMLRLFTEGPQPLLAIVVEDGVTRFGPSPELRALLARAPPVAVRALLRDPAKALGVKDIATKSADELAELVFGFLRGAVWQQDAVEGAPAPAVTLKDVVSSLRDATDARNGGSWVR